MDYPVTLLTQILAAIAAVISGGKVLVTATLTGIGDLATQATLATLAAKDFATQATLALVDGKLHSPATTGSTKPVGWAINGTSAKSAALSAGYHWIVANVAWYWRQGPQASVTVDDDPTNDAYGELLAAGQPRLVLIDAVNDTIAGITSGATGEAQAKSEDAA